MIKIIKLNAKRALNNNRFATIAQVLILSGISILALFISLITYGILSFDGLLRDLRFPPPEAIAAVGMIGVIFFLLLSPLKVGIKAWYYRLSESGKGEDISYCFLPFENGRTILNSVKLTVSLGIKKLFTYFIFTLIPFFISFYAFKYLKISQTAREQFLSISCLFCGLMLLILALIFSYLRCLKYSQVYYCFAENEFQNVKGSFKMSSLMTKDRKGALLLFNLSMIHLYILNLCPVTALYSYPYMQTAKAIYGKFLIENLYRENDAAESSKTTEN